MYICIYAVYMYIYIYICNIYIHTYIYLDAKHFQHHVKRQPRSRVHGILHRLQAIGYIVLAIEDHTRKAPPRVLRHNCQC